MPSKYKVAGSRWVMTHILYLLKIKYDVPNARNFDLLSFGKFQNLQTIFKKHSERVKTKLESRNNTISKLAGSSWGFFNKH